MLNLSYSNELRLLNLLTKTLYKLSFSDSLNYLGWRLLVNHEFTGGGGKPEYLKVKEESVSQ